MISVDQDLEQRLDRLERENTDLRKRLAAIEERGSRKILPPPRVEEGARIIPQAPVSSFAMPSEAELTRLAEIVCGRYPALADTTGPAFEGTRQERRADWFTQFEASFFALGHMHRLAAPDRHHT